MMTALVVAVFAASCGYGLAKLEQAEEDRAFLSSALVIAVANRNEPEVERLLARGADPNARFNAPRPGAIFDRLALFLGFRPKPDPGDPVLVMAAHSQNVPLLKLLLQHGADVLSKDAAGSTALSTAVERNDVEAQKLLRSYGARE